MSDVVSFADFEVDENVDMLKRGVVAVLEKDVDAAAWLFDVRVEGDVSRGDKEGEHLQGSKVCADLGDATVEAVMRELSRHEGFGVVDNKSFERGATHCTFVRVGWWSKLGHEDGREIWRGRPQIVRTRCYALYVRPGLGGGRSQDKVAVVVEVKRRRSKLIDRREVGADIGTRDHSNAVLRTLRSLEWWWSKLERNGGQKPAPSSMSCTHSPAKLFPGLLLIRIDF
ncbi:hypothetical protein K438DRAFT_1781045 [Mycena galopus ATCC 62051]|nr:hypothetical protein K438DRAFT_1781045 [Mycena galopus ATCC 62051]